jgi:hypothetical protein
MISGDSLLRPHKDVIHTKLANGEVVLLHLTAGQYFSLNETGSRIWQLLDGKTTLSQISQDLESRYEVSEEQALSTVMELAAQLLAQELATAEAPAE